MSAAARDKVIIFGPTGHVGGAVASSLHGLLKDNPTLDIDPQIVLGMRNPSKAIRGTSNPGSSVWDRVKADLSDPESLNAAVSGTGATRAFIYLLFTSQDGMRSSLEALKNAGIRFVVFLSSFSIQGPIDAVQESDIIPYRHAAVEKNLEELFPDAYVTLRPGMFATNTTTWKDEIQKGAVSVFQPDLEFDYVAYEDIGAIAASVLLFGPQRKEDKIIPILGPQELSQENAVKILGRVLSSEVRISSLDFEQGVQQYVDNGTPEFMARYLVSHLAEGNEGEIRKRVAAALEKSKENVKRYTGREAMKFEEWCEKNKDLFS